ncbi:Asp-tRNA(Asn)/Glu-tRNA(Gln) amidotransferase subunit GatB [Desulfovibrio inopinatus]|uniref:Asp-tRNA(Asn)/Glu-tRNA(Gln) amidotransferase subunit GatB n=1 Tax=Desulfovibrio inopinatus TaxID=102109 RepID=UPI000427022F|nr:Asp-tRNA(Asn)/Glu-tRNA(Gln) amidotransferase subunit GatB [Desulfovibrio inopinatus]
MARYEAVIGLEVHAQLKTKSKIFCSCSTTFGNEPNENVCAVCAGMPGVLPVMNEKVLEYAAKMGMAVGCTINNHSIFARKNYFYPDLPKGYQISQYEEPLCEHGHIDVEVDGTPSTIGITRIHMEEDAGKSIHSQHENKSYVDLNRTGVPLIEIVSEPDIRSAEEAVAYLKELRSILLYLDICDGNMEEGSFRCDANISLRPIGQKEFGTRAEIKNMNSFRNVQKGIEYEIARQEDLLDDDQPVIQETRLYDADKNVTMSMRGKEEANDYRYFPDPDLVPLAIDPAKLKEWRESLPELPAARRTRFMSQYGLTEYDADTLTSERELADYFEEAVTAYNEPKKIANWLMGEFIRECKSASVGPATSPLRPVGLAKLVELIDKGLISGKIGKQIFSDLFSTGADPEAHVQDKGLVQISDSSALEDVVKQILVDNPKEVDAYKGGKTKLIGFFVGQVMKKTKGQANPGLVNDLLRKLLS